MCIAYPFFVNDMNLYVFYFLSFLLKNLLLGESFLKRKVLRNVFFLSNINSYRGNRLKNFLPSRGQRTRTNAGTLKRFKIKVSNNM